MGKTNYDRNVTVPHEFFRKSRADYADWRWSMVREFVQNSYDAGATRIDFEVEVNDTHTLLRVRDNGCGMDSDVLHNKLLCLGGTHKKDSSTAVGGFGVAKLILFFSHDWYEIRTNELLVRGSGGQYESSVVRHPIQGTHVTVALELSEQNKLRDTLRNYVSNMYPDRNIVITLDGQVIEQDSIEYDDELTSELGKLYIRETPDASSNRLMIVHRGLPMFCIVTYGAGTHWYATVNLEADYTWFTSNRDGLVAEHSGSVHELVNALCTERKGLVMSLLQSVTVCFERDTTSYVAESLNGSDEQLLDSVVSDMCNRLIPHRNMYPNDFALKVQGLAPARSVKSGGHTPASVELFIKSKRVAKLAHTWDELVKYLMGLPLMADSADSNVIVKPGFLLGSEHVDGMMSRTGDTCHVLMNVKNLPSDWMYDDLVDLAIHEVVHIICPNHNEFFTSATDKLRAQYRRSL